MEKDYFFGSLTDAPTQIASRVGSLIPIVGGSKASMLHVAAGLSPKIEAIHLTDPSTHLTIVIDRGANAQVTVWLEGGNTMTNAMEVIVDDEAMCTILCINACPPDAALTIKQQSQVGSGATVQWQNVTLGGATVAHDLLSRVIGHDGSSGIDWMFYAKGSEKQNLTVRNIFDGENGGGEILMRGVAEEQGHTVCKGLIDIGLDGGGTNTYLTQQVLMLDATSKVDAIPALEIKTNDVKASHSATVARVTEEDLFYFAARGIDPNAARRMFVLGFLGDITQRIRSDESRQAIVQAIERKYGN